MISVLHSIEKYVAEERLSKRSLIIISSFLPYIQTFLQTNSKTDYQRDVSNESTAPRPRHAWRSADSPITDVNQLPVGKATIDHDQMSMTSGVQSHVSHRAEELTNEW